MPNSALEAINQLTTAFFSAFDNRAGKSPDFSTLASLFATGAIIAKCGATEYELMSVSEFIEPRRRMLTDGSLMDFHEWEIAQQTFINGGIATRISKYRKQGLWQGQHYAGQGDKHLQFILTPVGWKIMAIIWQD